jgi:hypothetical protein
LVQLCFNGDVEGEGYLIDLPCFGRSEDSDLIIRYSPLNYEDRVFRLYFRLSIKNVGLPFTELLIPFPNEVAFLAASYVDVVLKSDPSIESSKILAQISIKK